MEVFRHSTAHLTGLRRGQRNFIRGDQDRAFRTADRRRVLLRFSSGANKSFTPEKNRLANDNRRRRKKRKKGKKMRENLGSASFSL